MMNVMIKLYLLLGLLTVIGAFGKDKDMNFVYDNDNGILIQVYKPYESSLIITLETESNEFTNHNKDGMFDAKHTQIILIAS